MYIDIVLQLAEKLNGMSGKEHFYSLASMATGFSKIKTFHTRTFSVK